MLKLLNDVELDLISGGAGETQRPDLDCILTEDGFSLNDCGGKYPVLEVSPETDPWLDWSWQTPPANNWNCGSSYPPANNWGWGSGASTYPWW